MAKSAYLSRKLLNQLAAIEADSDDMMLTHDLHNIAINGKKVGCSGHIANLLNGKCVYVNTEKPFISLCPTRTWFAMLPT